MVTQVTSHCISMRLFWGHMKSHSVKVKVPCLLLCSGSLEGDRKAKFTKSMPLLIAGRVFE